MIFVTIEKQLKQRGNGEPSPVTHFVVSFVIVYVPAAWRFIAVAPFTGTA